MENSYKQLSMENDKLKNTISFYENSMHNFESTNESQQSIKLLHEEKKMLQDRYFEILESSSCLKMYKFVLFP